jgi:hypothetical protein
MSVIEYKYQRATHAQLEKCVRWCLNNFQLRDWKIDLSTDTIPPKRFTTDEGIGTHYGRTWLSTNTLKAEMLINVDFIKADNANPYSTAIHEVFHILSLERADDVPEQYVMILEPILYRLYVREMGLKQAKEK